jgi:hypothetical protein
MMQRPAYGVSAATSIASITTSESSRTIMTNAPKVLTGIRANNSAGSGAVFTIRIYSASSGGKVLAEWDTSNLGSADEWDSVQFTQPIPVLRSYELYVTGEADAGSGHTLAIEVDYQVADVNG